MTFSVQKLLPGAAVVALGLFVGAIALTYPLGSGFRPGPGFFPLGVAGLLVVLGLLVAIEDLTGSAGEETGPQPWRPMAAVAVGLLVFAVLLERAGYVPASIALVILAALGERAPDWRIVGAIAAFMAVFGTVVFIWGLGLPILPVAGL